MKINRYFNSLVWYDKHAVVLVFLLSRSYNYGAYRKPTISKIILYNERFFLTVFFISPVDRQVYVEHEWWMRSVFSNILVLV